MKKATTASAAVAPTGATRPRRTTCPATNPSKESKEWFTRIQTCVADEVRGQRPDVVSDSLMIEHGDRPSCDLLVRIGTGAGGRNGFLDATGTPAADAITELAE